MSESAAFSRRAFGKTAKPTTLAGSIDNATTTITLVDGSTYPDGSTGPFMLTLDLALPSEERIEVATRTGNSLTGCVRGADGTTPLAHAATVNGVTHTSTTRDFDEANRHIADTTLDHHTQYARKAATNTFTAGQVFNAAVTGTAALTLTGTTHAFGNGAAGGAGSFVQVGHFDATDALVNAAGQGSNINLLLRSKGTGTVIIQDGSQNEILLADKVRGLRIGSAVTQPSTGSQFVHLAMANIGTAITDTPSSGGWVFVEAGALKFKGSAGTVTTVAPA